MPAPDAATGERSILGRVPLTRSEISSAAADLVAAGCELCLVSNRRVLDRLNLTPFGLPCTAVDFLAPGDAAWDARSLMHVYNCLNRLSFGAAEIAMDYWVMIDLGLLSSAFVLVTLPRELLVRLPEDARFTADQQAKLAAAVESLLAEADRRDFRGPVPVAGYCAAPTPAPGCWVGWSLCSIVPGLGTTTKGLALQVYGASTLVGVTQYGNVALRLHRKFGPMRLLSAALDLHPLPHALVYETDVYGPEDDQAPSFLMRCDDAERQRDLQAKIEAGSHTVHVLPPGLDRDGLVPILETS
jgi:hypothetical protein